MVEKFSQYFSGGRNSFFITEKSMETWKDSWSCAFMYWTGVTLEEEETLSFFWFCAMILSGKDVAMSIHFSTDCGCFYTLTADFSNCDRKHKAYTTISPPPTKYYLYPYGKSFAIGNCSQVSHEGLVHHNWQNRIHGLGDFFSQEGPGHSDHHRNGRGLIKT